MLGAISQNSTFTIKSSDINKINKQEPLQQEAKQNRLEAIFKQIEDGNYKIELNKLARKIADELI